jgi:hypothetical protein
MTRLIVQGLATVAVLGGVSFLVHEVWIVTAVAGVLGMSVWFFGRCPHPRPLGLLPPVTDAAGNRTPAQWYCGQCGQQFPATFEHARSPLPRFRGYDESKAPVAARRAAELDDRRRQLAVRRAGMTKRPDLERGLSRQGPVPVPGRRLAG